MGARARPPPPLNAGAGAGTRLLAPVPPGVGGLGAAAARVNFVQVLEAEVETRLGQGAAVVSARACVPLLIPQACWAAEVGQQDQMQDQNVEINLFLLLTK